jgi:hypothetical protein
MAQPAPADNVSDQGTTGGTSQSSRPEDLSNLRIPLNMKVVPDRAQPIRAPAVLIADFKEVLSDVGRSIHDLVQDYLSSDDSSKVKSSRFGFLVTEIGEVRSVKLGLAEVKEALGRSTALCQSIAEHNGDGTQLWSNVRILSDQFHSNAQGILIKLRSMNFGETAPVESFGVAMELLNQVQSSARKTAIQLYAVTQATMS